jgi:hypothetical protein
MLDHQHQLARRALTALTASFTASHRPHGSLIYHRSRLIYQRNSLTYKRSSLIHLYDLQRRVVF